MNNQDLPIRELKPLSVKDILDGNIIFHDPAHDIAEHATSLLLGQGFSVDILRDGKPDEKLQKAWDKIAKDNQFSQLIERNEYDISYYGSKLITISCSETKRILLMENDPRYFSKVATFQQISEISAIVYKKILIDQIAWTVKELWTDKSVSRVWYNAAGREATLEELAVEIPKEFQMPFYWEHNLGILPLKLFVNKNRNIVNLMEYITLADTYTSYEQIRALNLFETQQLKESILNITKVFGNFDEMTVKKMAEFDEQVMLLYSQMFVNTNSPGELATKQVEILKGDPAFDKYITAKIDKLKSIWRASGYTYMNGDETTATNADSLYANAFDIRTTKKKKTTRQAQYSDLITKTLIANKTITKEEAENIQVIFSIQENIVQTPNQIADMEIKLVESGMVSKADALMKIKQIPTLEQAQIIVDRAEAELKANEEANLKLMADMGGEETGNSKETASIEPNGVNE